MGRVRDGFQIMLVLLSFCLVLAFVAVELFLPQTALVRATGWVGIALPFVLGNVVARARRRRRRRLSADTADRNHEAALSLTPEQHPELWALVVEVARATRTRPPVLVQVTADANATAHAYAWSSQWRLWIGLPLLLALSRGELAAVLGHEFGHRVHGPRHLPAVLLRRLRLRAIREARYQRRRGNALTRRFVVPLLLRATSGLARREELRCDALAGSVAGTAAAASALRRIETAVVVWECFSRQYLAPGRAAGLRPERVFGGFAELLAVPSRAADWAARSAEKAKEPEDPLATHPALARRLAALDGRAGRTERDGRSAPAAADGPGAAPALGLLADPDAFLARADAALLSRKLLALPCLDWDDYGHVSGRTANSRRAVLLSARIRRAFGGEGDLGQLLWLLEQDRADALAVALAGDGDLAACVTALALDALSSAGRLRWSLTWAAPLRPVLLDADGSATGSPRALRAAVAAALADPAAVPALEDLLLGLGAERAHTPVFTPLVGVVRAGAGRGPERYGSCS